MRLIDADKLIIEKAYFHGKLPDPGNLYPDGKEAVDVDDIEDAPTVDAVEVIRCKDCKFAKKPYTPQMQKLYMICTVLHHTEIHMGKDAFCSYGERRTNEIN